MQSSLQRRALFLIWWSILSIGSTPQGSFAQPLSQDQADRLENILLDQQIFNNYLLRRQERIAQQREQQLQLQNQALVESQARAARYDQITSQLNQPAEVEAAPARPGTAEFYYQVRELSRAAGFGVRPEPFTPTPFADATPHSPAQAALPYLRSRAEPPPRRIVGDPNIDRRLGMIDDAVGASDRRTSSTSSTSGFATSSGPSARVDPRVFAGGTPKFPDKPVIEIPTDFDIRLLTPPTEPGALPTDITPPAAEN